MQLCRSLFVSGIRLGEQSDESGSLWSEGDRKWYHGWRECILHWWKCFYHVVQIAGQGFVETIHLLRSLVVLFEIRNGEMTRNEYDYMSLRYYVAL